MKRIISWLGSKFDRKGPTGKTDPLAEQEIAATGDTLSELDVPSKSDVAGWREDLDSPPDDHTVTVPILKVLDLNLPDQRDGRDTDDTTVLPE